MPETLTDQQIYQTARNAGFPPETAAKMVAIALKESGGNPGAYNGVGEDRSYGLWQINMIDREGYMLGAERRRQFGLTSNDQLLDPATNAKAAFSVWNGDDVNLEKHWYINNGTNKQRYDSFLPRAQAAASAVEGRNVIASTVAARTPTLSPSSSKSGGSSTADVREVEDQTGNYIEWRNEAPLSYPEPEVPQPYFATAEIWTYDTSAPASAPRSVIFPDINPLTIDWQGQTDLRLLEFQYKDRRKGAGQFLFRVFMRNLADVHRFAKLCSSPKGIEFRFGYTNVNGGFREPIKGFVLSYLPEFREAGYEVSIEGVDMAYGTLSDYKVRTFKAKTGRISDIVCHIVRQSGLDSKPVIETTTETDPNHPWKQTAPQTDWTFINEVLSHRARSKSKRADVGGNHAGYSAYMRDGKFHWHTIIPPLGSMRGKPVRHYVWGGVKDAVTNQFGTVINFNPEFHPGIFRSIGAGAVSMRSMNPITKEVNISTVQGSDVTDTMLGGNQSAVVHPLSPGEYPNRAFVQPDHQPDILEARTSDRFFNVRDHTFNATIRVLGDPWIGAMDVISVTVRRPNEPGIVLDYDWVVMEAIHTITNQGEYTTELKLVRNPTSTVQKEGQNTEVVPSARLGAIPTSGSQPSPAIVRKGVLEQKITVTTKVLPARVGELYG